MNITGATLSSVNTIYAQMMNTVVTPAKFIEIAGRTGIDIPKFDSGCALALGTTDVTPLEMARAYTTFAQRGNRPDPISILKIAEPNGRVIAEAAPKVEPALDRNVADSINYVLEQNIRSGTGTAAKIGRPAAGKTGTTQNHANAWFAGYTPDLTAVVWMGYAPAEDGTIKEMKNVHGIEVTGGSLPATIWRRFMSQALKGVQPRSFPKPQLEGVAVNYGGPDPSSATIAQANPSPSPGSDTRESDSEQPASGEDGDGEDVIGRPGNDDEPEPPEAGQTPRDNDDDDQDEEERPSPAATGTGFDDCFPFCD
jgi:penicillin-binding protein 1A